jgi:hypothetical protein
MKKLFQFYLYIYTYFEAILIFTYYIIPRRNHLGISFPACCGFLQFLRANAGIVLVA